MQIRSASSLDIEEGSGSSSGGEQPRGAHTKRSSPHAVQSASGQGLALDRYRSGSGGSSSSSGSGSGGAMVRAGRSRPTVECAGATGSEEWSDVDKRSLNPRQEQWNDASSGYESYTSGSSEEASECCSEPRSESESECGSESDGQGGGLGGGSLCGSQGSGQGGECEPAGESGSEYESEYTYTGSEDEGEGEGGRGVSALAPPRRPAPPALPAAKPAAHLPLALALGESTRAPPPQQRVPATPPPRPPLAVRPPRGGLANGGTAGAGAPLTILLVLFRSGPLKATGVRPLSPHTSQFTERLTELGVAVCTVDDCLDGVVR